MSLAWLRTSITIVGVGLSLAVLATAAGLWRRSLAHADLVARVEPAGDTQRTLTGFGSYKGAVLFGSIVDPPAMLSSTEYAHNVFPVPKPGEGSILHVEPHYKRGTLGFGVSRGQLRLTLPSIPLLFWVKPPPASGYHVVYVPYYFIMLLALVHPARVGRRVLGFGRGGPAARPLRGEVVEATC